MIRFERYPHVNDFIAYYLAEIGNSDVGTVIHSGIKTEKDAKLFSTFIWKMVDQIHHDKEKENVVFGSNDNTDILPDVSYEVTNHMRKIGFFSIWEEVSDSFLK